MSEMTKFRLPNINAEWTAVETTFSSAIAIAEDVLIAQPNPQRYCVAFCLNEGGVADRVTTKSGIGVLQGISLTVANLVMINMKDFGPLPFFNWFFNNNTMPWNITVFEVFQIK